jgi:hypothetical protein
MILDTNTWVGHWPFQRLAPATPTALMRRLRAEGIERAWTAAADAVLYPDPQQGNEVWLPRIAKVPGLVPVAVIDPTLPNWPASLDRCVAAWGARVVKLVPSYHRLDLSDPRVDELIGTAAAGRLAVSIQFRLEDERRHHPLMKVPPPAVDDLLALARRHPRRTFHVACAYLNEAVKLAAAPNLVLEISSLESLDTLRAVTAQIPVAQLCFGSYTPFYYTRAAVLKLRYTELDVAAVGAIGAGPMGWLGL